MLSRLVTSTLGKLSTKESTTLKSPQLLYPTLSFPPPPPGGTGSRSLCARCLTLLSYVITQYGDATGYKDLVIPHSSSVPEVSQIDANLNAQRNEPLESNTSSTHPPCVTCIKTLTLFNAARAHISFEPSLRNTPCNGWSLSWRIDAPDPKIYPQFAFPHDSVSVLMTVRHTGGYGWGIGKYIRISLMNVSVELAI